MAAEAHSPAPAARVSGTKFQSQYSYFGHENSRAWVCLCTEKWELETYFYFNKFLKFMLFLVIYISTSFFKKIFFLVVGKADVQERDGYI